MSAAPLDLRTPQMECPTCRAIVRITAKGTIAQHTRGVAKSAFSRGRRGGWHHSTVDKRCPSSFTAAPEGAYEAWLRGQLAEFNGRADRLRALAVEAMAKADGFNREAESMHERALQHALALDALGDGAP